MNFKLAYTLVSKEKDIYLEQAILSMYSAKYHMPEAKISLIIDDRTQATLTGSRKKILDYVDELIYIELNKKYNNKIRSRLLKTNIRNYIKGDFLYIDTDTIICGDLSDLDNVQAPISAVWDRHCIVQEHPRYRRIKSKTAKVGANFDQLEFYFNGGVMLVKDCEESYALYTTWNQNYIKHLKDLTTDQPTLALSLQQLNLQINTLPGIYNCQIENGIRYFRDMKIMHYFASMFLRGSKEFLSVFQDADLYDEMKKTGKISESLKNLVLNPELSLATGACLYPPSPLFGTRMFTHLRRLYRNEKNILIKSMLPLLKFSITILTFICLGQNRHK